MQKNTIVGCKLTMSSLSCVFLYEYEYTLRISWKNEGYTKVVTNRKIRIVHGSFAFTILVYKVIIYNRPRQEDR